MIIAVDPGKAGGVAFLLNDGQVEAYPMPASRLEYLELLETMIEKDRLIAGTPRRTAIRAVVEKVSPMPSQGKVRMPARSAFTFGQNFEIHLSMFTALKIPFEEVLPRAWQKYLNFTKPKLYKEGKEYLRMKAQEMYPETFYGKNLTWSRATCDAVLILEYARKRKLDNFKEM